MFSATAQVVLRDEGEGIIWREDGGGGRGVLVSEGIKHVVAATTCRSPPSAQRCAPPDAHTTLSCRRALSSSAGYVQATSSRCLAASYLMLPTPTPAESDAYVMPAKMCIHQPPPQLPGPFADDYDRGLLYQRRYLFHS